MTLASIGEAQRFVAVGTFHLFKRHPGTALRTKTVAVSAEVRIHLPFRQRVAMRYRMPPMDEEQTCGYVDHQLKLVGRTQRLFTDEAMMQLFVQSGGVARVVGNLALTAMTEAVLLGKDVVELDEVIIASKEVM